MTEDGRPQTSATRPAPTTGSSDGSNESSDGKDDGKNDGKDDGKDDGKNDGKKNGKKSGKIRFRVIVTEDGLMLRQLLCRRIADLPPKASADLIKAGGVYVDNVRVRIPSVRVAVGERLTIYRSAADCVALEPAQLQIVHRDPDFVIIDKPVGVPPNSTRASARGTVAQALVHRLSADGVLRPYVGPVRPIPGGASGLVLYTARGQDAVSHQRLYLDAQLETVDLLLLEGAAPETMRCDEPVLMTRSGRLKICAATAHGATAASTVFRRVAVLDPQEIATAQGPGATTSASACTLVEATSTRGAGAQAAVHAATLGFPVVQAMASSDAPASLRLHRARITLVHPHSGERLCLESPPPAWARATDE